jgi:hypothetical protein
MPPPPRGRPSMAPSEASPAGGGRPSHHGLWVLLPVAPAGRVARDPLHAHRHLGEAVLAGKVGVKRLLAQAAVLAMAAPPLRRWRGGRGRGGCSAQQEEAHAGRRGRCAHSACAFVAAPCSAWARQGCCSGVRRHATARAAARPPIWGAPPPAPKRPLTSNFLIWLAYLVRVQSLLLFTMLAPSCCRTRPGTLVVGVQTRKKGGRVGVVVRCGVGSWAMTAHPSAAPREPGMSNTASPL